MHNRTLAVLTALILILIAAVSFAACDNGSSEKATTASGTEHSTFASVPTFPEETIAETPTESSSETEPVTELESVTAEATTSADIESDTLPAETETDADASTEPVEPTEATETDTAPAEPETPSEATEAADEPSGGTGAEEPDVPVEPIEDIDADTLRQWIESIAIEEKVVVVSSPTADPDSYVNIYAGVNMMAIIFNDSELVFETDDEFAYLKMNTANERLCYRTPVEGVKDDISEMGVLTTDDETDVTGDLQYVGIEDYDGINCIKCTLTNRQEEEDGTVYQSVTIFYLDTRTHDVIAVTETDEDGSEVVERFINKTEFVEEHPSLFAFDDAQDMDAESFMFAYMFGMLGMFGGLGE